MGETVKLRRLEIADTNQLAQLANNRKVWDCLRDYFPHPYHEQDARNFIELTQNENPPQNFGIEYNDELCGVIGVILQQDVYKKSGEIGYWLGEPFWSKGIGTEAVSLITKYGFSELNLIRLYAGIFSFNKPSMKVLEKNGFQKDAIFRNAILKNGKIYDEHRYFKLK